MALIPLSSCNSLAFWVNMAEFNVLSCKTKDIDIFYNLHMEAFHISLENHCNNLFRTLDLIFPVGQK